MVDAKFQAEELERAAIDASRKQLLDAQKDKKSERKIEYSDIDENVKVDENTSGLSEGAKLIAFAKKYVGHKYVWAGNDLNTGVDCSGFVQQVYAHFGYNSLPRTSYEQCNEGKVVNGIENAKLGDIFCFYDDDGRFGHVALYAGTLSNGEGESSGVADGAKAIVHAANSREFKYGGGIRFSNIKTYYKTPGKIVRIIN